MTERERGFESAHGHACLRALDTGVPSFEVWVEPEHRGREEGKRLAQEAIDWARAAGYGGLMARVEKLNTPGQALLAAMGFRLFASATEHFVYLLRFAREGALPEPTPVEHGLMSLRAFRKEEGDRARVLEFFAQMGGESRSFFNRADGNERDALAFFAQDKLHRRRWMATADIEGRSLMVGYLVLIGLDTRIPILGIAMREDFKGRRLGGVLIDEAKRYVVDSLGGGGIELTTALSNHRGQGLYSRCGFVWQGEQGGEWAYLWRATRA